MDKRRRAQEQGHLQQAHRHRVQEQDRLRSALPTASSIDNLDDDDKNNNNL